MAERDKWLRSQQYSWAASKKINVELDFLEEAKSYFKAPVIDYMIIRGFNFDITAAGGESFASEQSGLCVDTLFLKDGKHKRYDCHGYTVRAIAIHELGNAYVDPAAISAAQLTTYEWELPLIFAPPRTRKRNEYNVAVTDFINGGRMQINCPPAAIATHNTLAAGTYEVWAHIVENENAELKCRMVWEEQDINNLEDYYPVNGTLRAAFAISMTDHSLLESMTGLTELDSTTLDYTDIPLSLNKFDYRHETRQLHTADPVSAAKAWPIYNNRSDQKLVTLPNVGKLHLKFTGTLPTAPKLVVCSIIDRDPVLSAKALGFSSPAALSTALASSGYIKGANGKRIPLDAMSGLSRRMPVKV